ncbi:MAG: methyltransferase domain-containing protein, partial [Acidiferrobacterales bacterium]|nr:methyltransferase domain-containing protein [Acidiferrobacterales bacterium]
MLDAASPTASLDRKQVRMAFERAAGTYDRSAVLQREIGKRMLGRLDLVTCSPQTIVDVGCGTGYCTRALHRRYRRAHVLGVDIAEAMLGAARQGVGWFGRQHFGCGDASHLPLANGIA